MGEEAHTEVTYEYRLNRDFPLALREGSAQFYGGSSVDEALRKIVRRLDEIGVDYAVVGGMALFRHGLRRSTEHVEILVSSDGLKTIHERLDDTGYRPLLPESRNLRDAELGVRIEFLVAGEYPGDGKPKPVAFPEPASVAVEMDGIRFINLPALVELKLASGMTNPGRLRDLADVVDLIQAIGIGQEFGERLDPSVQAKYDELWRAAQAPQLDKP